MNQDDCESKKCASAQLVQKQKNQLIDLTVFLERYRIVLIVFGFNVSKYDLNLIKSFLLPIVINERGVEPALIKRGKPGNLVQTW